MEKNSNGAGKIELNVDKREIVGKGLAKLREQGIVPGVIYGHNFDAINIQVDHRIFSKVYEQAGESTMIYVNIDGNSYPSIIQDVDIDPVDDHVIHVDFYKVKLDEKITAEVPLVFVGESPAVIDQQGILLKNINEVEVEAYPQDLPSEIEVDVSSLKTFEDQILIKDIKTSEKIEIKSDSDEVVVLVQEPISEEKLEAELEEETGEAKDVEVIGEKDKESADGDDSEDSPSGGEKQKEDSIEETEKKEEEK